VLVHIMCTVQISGGRVQEGHGKGVRSIQPLRPELPAADRKGVPTFSPGNSPLRNQAEQDAFICALSLRLLACKVDVRGCPDASTHAFNRQGPHF
jgi:hypothetical protein